MSLLFQSQLARSDKYRPDIDGLRALAILPVLFYHARVLGFSGGYVGVDIFYVISGYLITSIIARDIALGKFSFKRFYERRMRRIFPALFTASFFTILAAVVFLAPADLADFGRSLMAMVFFVSNLFFRREAGAEGYFDSASDRQALLHTWSLSVEEQFYLFFPATLILLARWARGREIVFVGAAVVASFTISVWAVGHKPLGAFYLLVPRAWELLIGSLLAMKAVPPLTNRVLREIAGWMGLGAIAWAVFMFTADTAFPGISALYPCLGAWLIMYAGEGGESSVKALLSMRPVVFIGVISYSLYLWHWPILVFSRYFNADELSAAGSALAIAASVVMAFVSFEYIERPFRGKESRISRRQVFVLGGGASAVAAAVGLMFYASGGLPGRYDAHTQAVLAQNVARRNDFKLLPCANWKKEVHSRADIETCNVGDKTAPHIMFLGDSHVEQLYPLVEKLYAENALGGHRAVFAIADGCLPVEHMNVRRPGYHCDNYAHYAMERAEEKDIDTVFIGFSVGGLVEKETDVYCPSAGDICTGVFAREEQVTRFLAEFAAKLHRLKAGGKRLIVALPFPIYDKYIPELEIRNAVFGPWGLGTVPTETGTEAIRNQIEAAARSEGAEIFDPRLSLCAGEECTIEVDGVSVYKDKHHIAAGSVGILEKNLSKVLQGAR